MADTPDAPAAVPATSSYRIEGPNGEVFRIEGAGTFEDALKALGIGAPQGPAFDSPEFDQTVAQKYGATPEFVHAAKEQAMGTAGAEGVPIAGAYARNAAAAMSAASPWHQTEGGHGVGSSGETFSERYQKNRDLMNDVQEGYREAHPVASRVAPIAGGVMAMAPLGATALGARLLGVSPGASLLGSVGRGATSGAAIGGADAAARGTDIPTGVALGGVFGGGAPVVGRAIGTVLSPVVNNVLARTNPQGYAERQVARAITESGQTPQQIADQMVHARLEGQPEFTAADAMGNAGQRMLASVAKAPGEGRTLTHNFLEGRQYDQGRRIASQLAEGFQSPQTGEQVGAAMTAARDAAADAQYNAARAGAQPVNILPVIHNIDATLRPGANQVARPASGIANDTIESALESVRRRLTDNRSLLTDFTALQRVRGDLSDMVQQAVRGGQGNRARLLGGVLRSLDQQMETASPGFLQANRNFSQASRDIEAIGQGRTAAMRGRTENTIPAYQGLSPQGQAAFRAGYVDPLIEQVQGAAATANKARPFTSDAFGQEAGAMAPNAARMGRQLERENTMFETRRHALGGSSTAENLADSAAMGVDAGMIGNILTGNFTGALHQALGSVTNGITGNTPAVRRAVAQILLARGTPPAELQRMLDQTVQRITETQQMAQRASRTLAGTLAVGANRALAPPPSPSR